MATEPSRDQEGFSANEAPEARDGAATAVQVPSNALWYRYVNEDWFATIVGLLLVLLIVVGLIHAIP
jgi:hypothetical protein